MLFKLKVADTDNGEDITGWSWTIYDNIRKISFDSTSIPEEKLREKTKEGRNVHFLHDIFVDATRKKNFMTALLFIDDKWKSIAFNSEAFICNDNGTVIEKLEP